MDSAPKNLAELQVGDIAFTRQPALGSWLLRVTQGPFPYSHVSIIGEDVNGKASLYTPGHTGANHWPLAFVWKGYLSLEDAEEYLATRSYTVCRYKSKDDRSLTADQRQKILDHCKKHLNERFPAGKIGLWAKIYLKGRGITSIKRRHQNNAELCFQFVAAAYQEAGIELTPRAENTDSSGYDAKEIYLSPYLVNIRKVDRLSD